LCALAGQIKDLILSTCTVQLRRSHRTFIIEKIPSFWLLAIVQTHLKKRVLSSEGKALSSILDFSWPTKDRAVYRRRLHHIVSQCGVNLSWPFAESFAHFLLFSKNFNACNFFDQTSRSNLMSAVRMQSTGLVSRYITA
jgi:hypothetical protein